MWKFAIALVFFLSAADVSGAQYGTAENGYYPDKYFGSTFTGTVKSTNDETREVTLNFIDPRKSKDQTFVGVLDEGYSVQLKDGTLHELKPSEIRPGALIKVYYMPETKKVAGKKTTINTVILIGGTPNAHAQHVTFKPFR